MVEGVGKDGRQDRYTQQAVVGSLAVGCAGGRLRAEKSLIAPHLF